MYEIHYRFGCSLYVQFLHPINLFRRSTECKIVLQISEQCISGNNNTTGFWKFEAPPGSLDLSFIKSYAWSPEVGWGHNKGFNLDESIEREHLSKFLLLNHLAKKTETGMGFFQVSLDISLIKSLYIWVLCSNESLNFLNKAILVDSLKSILEQFYFTDTGNRLALRK